MSLQREVWTLGQLLGKGGFGEVRAAWTASGELGAAKLVPKEPGANRELLFADPPGVRHVVPVIDSGETETHLVIVMPRAEKSLRRHLDEHGGALESVELVVVLTDVAETLVDLAEFHGGLVHRDLKPENVLLLNGHWCTSDFGIARYAESATASDTRKHAKSSPYAAPERWRDEETTPAVDVYAFGVMAYEMLAGERPFKGEEHELRDQHLHSVPPRLRSAPPQLAGLIDMCLFKPAASRPPSADLCARLKRSGVRPRLAGLVELERAGRVEALRLAEVEAGLSQARTDEDRRGELLQAAESSFQWILRTMRDAFEVAPAAEVRITASGLDVGMNKASLVIDQATRSRHDGQVQLPFDVVAYAKITVERPRDRLGYEGREHSLWYGDAHEVGRYQWFETAFMMFALHDEESAVSPFAVFPGPQSAMAVAATSARLRHAWPFTPVVPGDMDDFVDRWTGYFTQAALGTLSRPARLPELPVEGSWKAR